jgi:glycosyltransferase involved in cell wall biosynthesis
MIKGRDIVCISFVTWDDHWGTPQQLMSRLAAHNRVFFVDQPVSPLSFVTGIRRRGAVAEQVKRWRGGARQVADNIYAGAPPPVLPLRYNRFANAINAFFLRRWLRLQTKRLGFKDPIYWNFQPGLPHLKRAVRPSLAVYHCVDDFASVPHWWNPASAVRARERECCVEADVVICTGRKLVASRRQFNPNIHFVPEGADVSLFERAADAETQIPEDIAKLAGKVIGYIGVIDFRLDVELLTRIAKERPDYSIALVGPVKSDTQDLQALQDLPNVHFFGNRPIEALPAYIKAMDVCLIPYVLNDYVHHIFPLKLYEYMAAGKPIVATDMEEMRPYAGAEMTIAKSHEAFLAAVDDAIAHDTVERAAARQATAQGESWGDRVERISAILQPMLAERERPVAPVGAGTPVEVMVER